MSIAGSTSALRASPPAENNLFVTRSIRAPGGCVSGFKENKSPWTSKATATRDLQDLVEMGIFSVAGGGRSVSYRLIL